MFARIFDCYFLRDFQQTAEFLLYFIRGVKVFLITFPPRIRMEHLTAITQEESSSLRKREVAGTAPRYCSESLLYFL